MKAGGDGAASYSLRRVQSMLGLSRRVIGGLIAEGFVTPTRGAHNAWRFSFQDLMLLRTAHALRSAGIPPRRIVRSLARLRASLPDELPLTGLRITAQGAQVAVRDRDGTWAPETGQVLLDFEVSVEAGAVRLLERGAASTADDADAWFARGAALEAHDPAQAEAAYRRALELAPAQLDSCLNLTAMWCEAGRFDEVVELSQRALQHTPRSALLHFNRAVALDHLERSQEALAGYRHCLELDDSLADAHYNIARLHEQLGDPRSALRHFSAYRRLQK